MMVSVQHGIVAAFKIEGKLQVLQNMVNFSYRHAECFGPRSRNSDKSCIFRVRSAVLDGNRPVGIASFQKKTSDSYLPEPVDFVVQNFRFERPRPFRDLLV